jgi:hypothetical protein
MDECKIVMLKSFYLIVVIATLIGLCVTSIADDEPLMAFKFEQYPVKIIFKGKPVVPILIDKDAKRYRTAIRRGATDGPNFAGEYTIVTHGCGTCCNGFFMVNARTGKVYKRPFIVACHYKEGVPGYGLVGLDYRLDSKLLIVRGSKDEKGGGEYYYIWEKDQLKLLKSIEEVVSQ